MSWIRAVAVDLDGTIASQDRISEAALQALRDTRLRRIRTVLVTGRTLAALRATFPGLEAEFDVVIAENGGVLVADGRERVLAEPVPAQLADALQGRGIPLQRGQVLLATAAVHDEEALREIGAQGLDCWLLRNRTELMILPAGVSKGTGLCAALRMLGMSEHNLLAVGDAENDHSLFEVAELAAATSDAVPALRDHADLVLPSPDGTAVAEMLNGPVLAGEQRPRSVRRQLVLGTTAAGSEVQVASTPSTLLVVGGSGRGKSFLAGLIAEQLIEERYSVLVVDPHGEQASLATVPGVSVLRPTNALDLRSQTDKLAEGMSLVVDLTATADLSEIVDELSAVITAARAAGGRPHWIVVDEAHQYLGKGGRLRSIFEPTAGSYCLVTYRPEDLCPEVLAAADVVISVSPPVDQLVGAGALPAASLPKAVVGQATLVRSDVAAPPETFTVRPRSTAHQRHERKYSRVLMVPGKGFRFKPDHSVALPEARTIDQFRSCLQQITLEVFGYHLDRQDFARWLAESVQDRKLADLAARLQRDIASRHAADLNQARAELSEAILDRYPSADPDCQPES